MCVCLFVVVIVVVFVVVVVVVVVVVIITCFSSCRKEGGNGVCQFVGYIKL